MAKYRKKPVVIEAFLYDANNIFDHGFNPTWIVDAFDREVMYFEAGGDGRFELKIKTLEGIMTAVMPSYIIRGVKGELYACRADIFEETYEEVGE